MLLIFLFPLIVFAVGAVQYDDTTWPVDFENPQDKLSSPFGPRLLASENYRYDFHRGIDIPGSSSDEVLSVAYGQIFRVYEDPNNVYPNGGNVVIVTHYMDNPMDFKNESIRRYYSLYMHLDNFSQVAQDYLDTGKRNYVQKGDTLGFIGSSGTTNFSHLHFEIRLGTTCSLEYQLSHPGVCSYEGFDPHINPLTLLPYNQTDTYNISFAKKEGNNVTVSIDSPREELDINKIGIDYDGLVKYVDFNTRDGFNASSTESLDEPLYGGIFIEPAAFNNVSQKYNINVTFLDIMTENFSFFVEDIWGYSKTC